MHAWHRRHHWSYRRNASDDRRRKAQRTRARSRAGAADDAAFVAFVRETARTGQVDRLTVADFTRAVQIDPQLVRALPDPIRESLTKAVSLAWPSDLVNYYSGHKAPNVCPRGHKIGTPDTRGRPTTFDLIEVGVPVYRSIYKADPSGITVEEPAEDHGEGVVDVLSCTYQLEDGRRCNAEWERHGEVEWG